MKETIQFIINPISGYGKKDWIEKLIDQHLDKLRFAPVLIYTKHPGHARTLASDAVKSETDIVVAVGGDGTINEIVQGLVGSNVKLAIIPLGSGNGLGRHIGIPLNPLKAIKTINKGKMQTIDTCILNEQVFVNISGIGFDAWISQVFNQGKTRGVMSYIKCVISEFFKYKPSTYQFEIDGMSYSRELLTIAFANSQQYGNNAYIAPNASIRDGFMDVVFIRNFPLIYWPVIIVKTLMKSLHTSRYIQTYRTTSFSLSAERPFPIHVDGDYFGELQKIDVKLKPHSLNVIVGKENI